MDIIDQRAVMGSAHNVEEVWRALRRVLSLLPAAASATKASLFRAPPSQSDANTSRKVVNFSGADDGTFDAADGCGAALRFALGVFNAAGDSVDPASRGHLCSLFAELFAILGDAVESERLYNEAYSILSAHYGRDHLAISDFFSMMSAVRANAGRFMDAIRYAGRALAIRIARLGLVHPKTADCHFNLGILYRLADDFQNSLKHLKICREIRVVAFHEISEEVAVVDESIGYTEVMGRSLDKAYLAFYRSHRARCVLFGPSSASAQSAADYVAQVRYSCGTRFVAAVEVQDKTRSLMAIDESEAGTPDPFFARLNAALDEECRAVYSLVDLKDLVLSCVEEIARSESSFLEQIAPADASTSTVANAVFIELMEPIHSEDFARIFRQQTSRSSNEALNRGGLGVFQREGGGGNESDCESSRESGAADIDPAAASSPSPVRLRSSPPILAVQAKENEKERAVVTQKLREDPQLANTSRLEKTNLAAVAPGPSSSSDSELTQETAPRGDVDPSGLMRQPDDHAVALSAPAPASSGTSMVSPVSSTQNQANAPHKEIVAVAPKHETQSPSNANTKSNSHNKESLPLPRLGARPLLLVQDAEGKPGVLRAVAASDVLEAFQMRVFSSGIFAHLLSGTKIAGSKQLDKNYVEAPTRDKSKPIQAVPQPPPLPVGWPPRPPDEEPGASTRQNTAIDEGVDDVKPKNALASLFGALGAKQSMGAKGKDTDSAQTEGEPQMKLKQIHWDVVPIKATQGTLWDKGPDDNPDEYAQVDTESLFPDLLVDFELIKVAPSKALGGSKAPGGGSLPIDLKSALAGAQRKIVPPPSSALDPKRSQNLTIMLSKFGKTSPSIIAQAVQELNLEAINQHVIQIMIDQLPTVEEQQAVKKRYSECGSDSSKLDRAEQYVLETSKILKFSERLLFMQILMASEDTRDVVSRDAELIITLSTQLRESLKYRRLMHVLLSVGNALNKGSKKNVAIGFRLSSLSKLLQTKSNTGLSLLEYVVSTLIAKDPIVLSVSTDFAGLEDARRIMFSNLRADVTKIGSALKLGADLLEAVRKSEESPVSISKVEVGINEITRLVSELNARIEEAIKEFSLACEYLGEPVSDPETLFGQLQAFLAALAKTQKETHERVSRDKRRASLLVASQQT